MDQSEIRKIIHIDMDAFYASVEQRDNPELKGKPIAVGGSRARGVVAAASYEARKYGVHSAMPSVTAYRRCPDIIFVRPRFDVYKSVSNQIRSIFFDYTDLVEPLSLDEAYLDVTHNKMNMPSATLIAQEIRQRIKASTELTASAGISVNKFLAKTASDINKPNGQKLIKPEEAEKFVEKLKVEKFFGIGKVTAQKMKRMGIYFGSDIKSKSKEFLIGNFGKIGSYYYNISRAIDHRSVNPNRARKSISVENTFDRDVTSMEEIKNALIPLQNELFNRINRSKSHGKTVTLKIKYADFVQITRSKTADFYITSASELDSVLSDLLSEHSFEIRPIRLLGLGVSNLKDEDEQANSVQLTLEF